MKTWQKTVNRCRFLFLTGMLYGQGSAFHSFSSATGSAPMAKTYWESSLEQGRNIFKSAKTSQSLRLWLYLTAREDIFQDLQPSLFIAQYLDALVSTGERILQPAHWMFINHRKTLKIQIQLLIKSSRQKKKSNDESLVMKMKIWGNPCSWWLC